MMTLKDFEAFDLLLMGFSKMHEDSLQIQDLLDIFFSSLARHTNVYTALSTEVAQKMILEKFEKYRADAMRAEQERKRALNEANGRKEERNSDGETSGAGPSKRRGSTDEDEEHQNLGQELKETEQSPNHRSTDDDDDDEDDDDEDDDDNEDNDDDDSIPRSSTDEYFQEDDASENQLQPQNSNSENESDISNYSRNRSQDSEIEIGWSTEVSEFPARSQHAAVAVGNKLYSFGGFNYPNFSYDDRLDVFVLNVNELEMEWKGLSIKNNLKNQQLGQSAVAYKEFIFIFGGVDPQHKLSNLTHRLDSKTLKLKEVNVTGKVPKARYLHSAVVVSNQLIIFGGYNPEFKLTNDLHSLNLETFHWSKIKAKGIPPSPRSNHSATVCNDNFILIFGGYDCEKGKCSNELFCFDVNSEEWTQPKTHGTTPKRRQGHSAFGRDGLCFVFGGYYFNKKNDERVHLNDLFCYDPETFEWKEVKPIGEPPSPRRNFGCVALGDRVFIFGGENEKYLDDMFVLKMPCKRLARAVFGRVSGKAKADELLRGRDEDKEMMERIACIKKERESKKRKDRGSHSSTDDESNKKICVDRAAVRLNPNIFKVKIESDYIPPIAKVKVEPDE